MAASGKASADDDSDAVKAAWEEVIRTIPDKEGDRMHVVNRRKLDWFLGFLEGRARVRSPKWWAESLVSAEANRRDDIYFYFSGDDTYHDAGLDSVVAPPDTTLSKMDGKIILRVNKDSVAVPRYLFFAEWDDNGKLPSNTGVSAVFNKSRCYVAVHYLTGDYPLACIDRSTSKVLWTTSVAGAREFSIGGMAHQCVTVTLQDDRVVVFGCSGGGINAEGFLADNGTSVFRFSSYHSERDSRAASPPAPGKRK
jgi:hypothetical protein